MPRTLPLAKYLFTRLEQNGVNHVFGVPGDFTLKALDHVKGVGSKWIGNCNELNAGYAADGYARVGGLGALVTTYGVGELSAINAIAGAYAEHVPIIQIAGLPQRKHIEAGDIVHHTLGDRKTMAFRDMHVHVTASRAYIQNEKEAPMEIDRVITQALKERRPAYIQLPCDMVNKEVEAELLEHNLNPSTPTEDKSNKMAEDIVQQLRKARHPLILIDRGMGMDQLRAELNEFVRVSGLPSLTMPSGAGMIDHSYANYYGVHAGPVGQIDTMKYLQLADLVLAFGPMFSDTQTLGWSIVPEKEKTITVGINHVQKFHDEDSTPIDGSVFLKTLISKLESTTLANPDTSSLSTPSFRDITPSKITNYNDSISQTGLYLRLNPYLKPHDIIFLGNATPILGGRDFILPDPSCRVIASGLWFSIGHMLPAALGAALCQQQRRSSPHPTKQTGRVILFEGDGSFQVTAQELSTIIHHRLNVTIFLANNSGYAYERLIHNPAAAYHDVAPWDYLALPAAFGAGRAVQVAKDAGEEYSVDTTTLRTWRDLEDFLEDERFDNGVGGQGKPGLKLVDIRLRSTDVPEKFKMVFESAGKKLG